MVKKFKFNIKNDQLARVLNIEKKGASTQKNAVAVEKAPQKVVKKRKARIVKSKAVKQLKTAKVDEESKDEILEDKPAVVKPSVDQQIEEVLPKDIEASPTIVKELPKESKVEAPKASNQALQNMALKISNQRQKREPKRRVTQQKNSP